MDHFYEFFNSCMYSSDVVLFLGMTIYFVCYVTPFVAFGVSIDHFYEFINSCMYSSDVVLFLNVCVGMFTIATHTAAGPLPLMHVLLPTVLTSRLVANHNQQDPHPLRTPSHSVTGGSSPSMPYPPTRKMTPPSTTTTVMQRRIDASLPVIPPWGRPPLALSPPSVAWCSLMIQPPPL